MDHLLNDTASGSPLPLFHDVYYSVIAPPQLPDEDPGFTEAIDGLDLNGATHIPLDPSTGRIADLGRLSHIIATTIDFPDYIKAADRYIPVVRPTWIQRSLAKGKQEQVRQFSPDPAHFMHDVILCCAGLPDGDREAIAGGVIAMGGTFSESLTRLVTHLVTLTMDDLKVQAAVQKNVKCKILLPHWFDDCLRLKRRIQEDPYILPTPSVLQGRPDRAPSAGTVDDISTAMTPTPSSMPPSSANKAKADVFNGKSVLLAQDLNLSERTRETIDSVIQGGGGQVSDNLTTADIFICQYRENPDFDKAVKQDKDVGNLSWLYHLIIHNRWTNPMIRLLHYPIPRYGVPGMDEFKISVSNYTGFARVYLESLVKASGATFTKSMVQQNTHLITAHTVSDKCDAARDWNINIANHLWLEDSYARNRIQSLTVPQYTHFPNGTNLGEVIGRTPIDRTVIAKYFLSPTKDEDIKSDSSIDKDDHAAEKLKPTRSSKMTGLRTSAKKKNTTDVSTPRPKDGVGKENIRPEALATPASRASKQKALSNIHNAAQDIALYDKERKRKGGVVHGRDRNSAASTPPPTVSKSAAKRKAMIDNDVESSDEEEDQSDVTTHPNKRAKTSKSEKIKVLVSMYDRWREKPELEQPDKAKLRNLGIHVINDPTASGFILCVPKILRTKKFACALAYGPSIVSTDWLDACLATKEVADADDYQLDDAQGEEQMSFSLSEALDRAVQNKRKLLRGWQIFCTEKAPGGFDTFKDIIDTNGGSCCLFRAKTKMAVSKVKLNGITPSDSNANLEEELYLLSGTSLEEQKLWPAFEQMAAKAEMVPRIVKIDWLLNIAISQDIRRDRQWDVTKSKG